MRGSAEWMDGVRSIPPSRTTWWSGTGGRPRQVPESKRTTRAPAGPRCRAAQFVTDGGEAIRELAGGDVERDRDALTAVLVCTVVDHLQREGAVVGGSRGEVDARRHRVGA